MKINTDTKVKGVSFDKQSNQWRARITAPNVRIFLGRFALREQAVFARKIAEKVIQQTTK